MTIDQVKAQFDAYLKAFNTHDVDNFGPFLAEDFHFHVPALPPANSKEEVLNQFTNIFFPAFREEIHPTFLSFGERSVAMEAIVKCEAKMDLDQPLPFTGLTYRKGEKFEYPIVVHYEFDNDLKLKTLRGFGQCLPDGGEGIRKEVLPGY